MNVADALLQHGRAYVDYLHSLSDRTTALGAKVNIANSFGNTPLHEASRAGHPDIVSMLLEAGKSICHYPPNAIVHSSSEGASVEAVNKKGSTPLHFACFEETPSDEYTITLSCYVHTLRG